LTRTRKKKKRENSSGVERGLFYHHYNSFDWRAKRYAVTEKGKLGDIEEGQKKLSLKQANCSTGGKKN